MTINHNGIEIELTSDELFKAYQEQKYLFMYDFVQSYCEDRYTFNDLELKVLTTETMDILDDYAYNDEEAALLDAIYNLKRVGIL